MSYEIGSRKPKIGESVLVVQKKDYSSGKLTSGTVKDVLTSKEFHPRGHKVRLSNGTIGRVQAFADQKEEEEVKIPKEPTRFAPAPDELV